MIFLAGLLHRSSLSFIFVSVIRVLSILTLLLGIAIEIFLIVTSIRNVHRENLKNVDSYNTSQLTVPNTGSTAIKNNTTVSSSSQAFANRPLNSTGNLATESDYISGTFVPTTPAGILFVTLEQLINIVILILCLLSEISLPPIPNFFASVFPPLGQGWGVGILGGLQVYVASTLLSHKLEIASRASSWILFIVGSLNISLGVIFGARIRSKRSLLDAGTNYAKKATHIDDIETGIKFARKGKNAGKKMFKGLRTSQISRPKTEPADLMAPSRPMEISRPIIGYIHSSPKNSIEQQIPTRPAPAYAVKKKTESSS